MSAGAQIRRSYQLARRLRRFTAGERHVRRAWAPRRPPPGSPSDRALLASGLHSDKRGLYPAIEDASAREAYVDDLTALRFRMFNGKSGALLTQKDVLLRVLSHHLPWPLEHRLVLVAGDDPRPIPSLREQLAAFADGTVAVLPSRDGISPRLIDLSELHDPDLVPRGNTVLLRLTPLHARDHDEQTRQALRRAVSDPVVVQLATYWDATAPFIGHAVALRGGEGFRPGWPEVGPGLRVDQLDPSSATALAGVRVVAGRQGGLIRERRRPGLPVPTEALRALIPELLGFARRFPNLPAIGFSLLVVGDDLAFVDAENRLDVVHPQLFGPLLDDPRLRTAYLDAGMRPRDRGRGPATSAQVLDADADKRAQDRRDDTAATPARPDDTGTATP